MNEVPETEAVSAGMIVGFIRTASAADSLTRLSRLVKDHPGVDVAGLIASSEAEDIKKISGVRETYFFSEGSMTSAYALHLFRIEEKDPVRLVADTVRDESRIYPRPTDIRQFLEPPFSMRQIDIEETLNRIAMRPDTGDIRKCTASNGAVFLYSDEYLSPVYAEGLAEFIEVTQKDNP